MPFGHVFMTCRSLRLVLSHSVCLTRTARLRQSVLHAFSSRTSDASPFSHLRASSTDDGLEAALFFCLLISLVYVHILYVKWRIKKFSAYYNAVKVLLFLLCFWIVILSFIMASLLSALSSSCFFRLSEARLKKGFARRSNQFFNDRFREIDFPK